MLVSESYEGSRTPFEGDRQLMLRSLPQGAQVTRATLKLVPVAPPGGVLFEETLTFNDAQGDWGARKAETATDAEVDFHARRTLRNVTGSGLGGTTLQVDIGGLYVQINDRGAMSAPEDGAGDFTFPAAKSTGGDLPSLATQKFKLHLATEGTPRITRVGIRTTPSNLSLRLGSQPPFYARPGELARSEDVPDFSDILNIFLEDAETQDGFYAIPLTLHSDSLCRMDVQMEIEYIQKQAALPGGLTEAALSFDYSTLAAGDGPLVTVNVPAGARVLPGETTARVRGSFASSQIVSGPTGSFTPAGAVKVTPDRAQATPLIYDQILAVSGVDLLVKSVSRTAELALDVVQDADGKPFTQSLLPAQVRLTIDSQSVGEPSWISMPLPSEVQIQAETRVWLVLQCLQGEIEWSVANQAQVAAAADVWTAGDKIATDAANGTPLGMLYTDTGGLAWRLETAQGVAGPLVGMLHLRQPPARYQVPIELEVGQGSSARRVSLQRFEPLGRVDFDLNFEEVAQAITDAAAAAVAALPVGEHLLNAEFEAWQRVGDTPPDRLVQLPLTNNMFALASSPDGKRIYLTLTLPNPGGVGFTTGEFSTLASIAMLHILMGVDVNCMEPAGVIILPAGPIFSLAISPDGRRACAGMHNTLVWVDLENWQVLGVGPSVNEAPFLDSFPGKIVFSPDSSRLYVKRFVESDSAAGSQGSVRVLSTAELEQAFLTAQDFTVDSVQLAEIDLGTQIEPVALAAAADGSRLYVLTADRSTESFDAILRAYDGASLQDAGMEVPVGINPLQDVFDFTPRGALALSPDGKRLVAVNMGSGMIAVVSIPRGIRLSLQTLAGDTVPRPVAAVMDKDGNYAVIADAHNGALIVYDITRMFQKSSLTILPGGADVIPWDLTTLVGGEHTYALYSQGQETGGLAVLSPGALVPEEWSLTSGRTQPICLTDPFRLAVVLGDYDTARFHKRTGAQTSRARLPSAISQVLPVTGGAGYQFTFYGLSSGSEGLAEIFWYGGDCGVQQTDQVSIAAYDGAQAEFITVVDLAAKAGLRVPEENRMQLHRLDTTAPAGAELAEVRFSVPQNQIAVVDRVSLQATADAITNGDLHQIDQGQLVGWTQTPAGAAGVLITAEADGLRIRNGGAQTIALEQAVVFDAGVPYELAFSGRGEAANSGAVPQVELSFLDEAAAAKGVPVIAKLDPQNSDRLVKRGNSPDSTAAAMLRLVVPPGASILAKTISLEEVAIASVPLNFVAQAPGDLNISGLQVAYEIDPPPPPRQLPAGGLCPPTPPSGAPGADKHGCCYCPNCGETDDLCDPHESQTSGGQPAIEGTCCSCGARQKQISTQPPSAQPASPAAVAQPAATGVVAHPVGQPVAAVIQARRVERALPIAVVNRLQARGGLPTVVRKVSLQRTAPAVLISSSRSEPGSLAQRVEVSLAARMRRVFEPSAVQGIAGTPQPAASTAAGADKVAGADVVSIAPGEPVLNLPSITEVTGVTNDNVVTLTAAGLGRLEALANATPSEIASALPVADHDEGLRISRNARRLFKKSQEAGGG